MSERKQLKLGYSYWPTGRHASGWRHPGAVTDEVVAPKTIARIARQLEAAKFDFFFIGSNHASDPAAQYTDHNSVFKVESLTTAAFVAALTERIGVVATLNANWIDPYAVARAGATLDHLSEGRAALNFITSTAAGVNYGLPAGHRHSYARTTQLVELLKRLWESWDDGAIVGNRETGVWVDPGRAHPLNHSGEYFSVKGPLNLPRPPQGHLPLVHAGGSEDSKDFSARHIDIRFSPFVDLDWNRAYYADVKRRLPAYGRSPEDHLIAPGITFYVAETAAEAHAQFRAVQRACALPYDHGGISAFFGIDLSGVDPETRLLDVVDRAAYPRIVDLGPGGIFSTSNQNALIDLAVAGFGSEDFTLREFFGFQKNGPYPQSTIVGSGRQVADFLEEGLETGAFDAVNVFTPYMPQPLDDFVNLVVAELQRRGVARSEYRTRTLREHLGLRPVGGAAKRAAA